MSKMSDKPSKQPGAEADRAFRLKVSERAPAEPGEAPAQTTPCTAVGDHTPERYRDASEALRDPLLPLDE